MNSQRMFLSLVPWLLFSVVINRHGANAAAIAALAAAALSLVLFVKDSELSGVRIIDVAGVVTFGVLAVFGFSGGKSVDNWIADYGRGSAALVLAVIMLGSAITVPFTEVYARGSVSREYWRSPVFRSVNRKISALWAGIVAVMGCGHLLAGAINPASKQAAGTGAADLILHWGQPAVLILFAVNQTQQLSDSAGDRAAVGSAGPDAPSHDGYR